MSVGDQVTVSRGEAERELSVARRMAAKGVRSERWLGAADVWEKLLGRMDNVKDDREKRLRSLRRTGPTEILDVLRDLDRPKFRSDDPDTAIESAMTVYRSGRQLSNKFKLYAAAVEFERRGEPFHSHRLCYAIGSKPHKTSTSVSDLIEAGLLDTTGDKMKTRDGGEGQLLRVAIFPEEIGSEPEPQGSLDLGLGRGPGSPSAYDGGL